MGINFGEIRKGVNPERYARMFFSMIESAVFMAG